MKRAGPEPWLAARSAPGSADVGLRAPRALVRPAGITAAAPSAGGRRHAGSGSHHEAGAADLRRDGGGGAARGCGARRPRRPPDGGEHRAARAHPLESGGAAYAHAGSLAAVLPRVGNWRPESVLAVLEAIRAAGVPVAQPPGAIRRGRDHWRTVAALAAAGAAAPGDRGRRRAGGAGGRRRRRLLGFPCVVKQRRSRQGVGVIRCASAGQLEAMLDSLWRLGDEVVVQRFCPPGGISRRVLVLDGEVLGATEHAAAPGEFRANAARGAAVRPVELAGAQADLARGRGRPTRPRVRRRRPAARRRALGDRRGQPVAGLDATSRRPPASPSASASWRRSPGCGGRVSDRVSRHRHGAPPARPRGVGAARRHPWIYSRRARRRAARRHRPGPGRRRRTATSLGVALVGRLGRLAGAPHGRLAGDERWGRGAAAPPPGGRRWPCATGSRIDSDAVRLVHAEGDGLPGLVVDRYGDAAVLEIYEAAWEPVLDVVVGFLTGDAGRRVRPRSGAASSAARCPSRWSGRCPPGRS